MPNPRLINLLLVFVLSSLFTRCSSSKIESNKDPLFTKKVSKIYIAARYSEGSKGFFRPFLFDYLKPEFSKHNIESTVYTFDPLSLETEKDLSEKITSYNPDVVMSIVQTERRQTTGWSGSRSYGTGETGATLDIKLFVPGKENPVWRGSLKVDGNFDIASYAAAKKATVKLIEKLQLDGIID